MRVLVTGATGFVGTALVDRLVRDNWYAVRAVVRRDAPRLPLRVERAPGALDADWDWGHSLENVAVVVHLAARVHVMRDRAPDSLAEYRRVNVDGTLNLARQAVAAGVRRFVFLSSVKVNGESGQYRESDLPAPRDPYGTSKLEAEEGLRATTAGTSMELTLIRSPLVYGPGVRANFELLMRAVARGIPLPFGAVRNRRSLVALDNLVDFVAVCMRHPNAANETFFVSDDEDLCTPDLIRRLARLMGRPARLVSIPPPVLLAAAALAGRHDLVARLVGSLCVDITKAKRHLSWAPPISVNEGLRRALAAHR